MKNFLSDILEKHKRVLHDGKSFMTSDYYEAIQSGELGTMDFYCEDEQVLGRLRNRVLTAARGRDHILQTTKTEISSLEGSYFILSVKYLGKLPPAHKTPGFK